MIRVDISNEMFKRAQVDAEDLGRLRNSVQNGGGNLAGFVGEEAAVLVLGGERINTYDYDFVTDNGWRVDAKTRLTQVRPRPKYECGVFDFNTEQDCDMYAFVRVRDDYKVAWVLGVYEKEMFYEDARFVNKGDYDISNNFTAKADGYSLYIQDLVDPVDLDL
jgi:hypothetical protein